MPHTLVPSDHVEAASVYGRGDEKIGTIERLMLEKKSGTVAYAVVRCGGLLKGEVRHYPVPWDSLKYNVARKAYTTNLTLEELRSGPSELDGEAFDWGDRSAIYRHPQYWSVWSSQPAASICHRRPESWSWRSANMGGWDTILERSIRSGAN